MSYYRGPRGPRRVRLNAYPVRPSGNILHSMYGMSGVSSQPPGPRVARTALVSLSGVQSQPPGLPVARMALTPLNGTALGDDTTLTAPTVDDVAWRTEMVTLQRELVAAQKHWAEGDRLQKWVQIAATVMIPVTAAIWRAIGVGRRRMR